MWLGFVAVCKYLLLVSDWLHMHLAKIVFCGFGGLESDCKFCVSIKLNEMQSFLHPIC